MSKDYEASPLMTSPPSYNPNAAYEAGAGYASPPPAGYAAPPAGPYAQPPVAGYAQPGYPQQPMAYAQPPPVYASPTPGYQHPATPIVITTGGHHPHGCAAGNHEMVERTVCY